MATDLLFYGHFVASKAGKTGLTPTVDIDKIEKATGTVTQVVTAGSATAGRRGYYLYRLASATPLTHDYVAIFITSDTSVDQQEVPATRIDYTEARTTELARLDATVSSRNATTPLDSTATQAAAAAALTAYDAATGADVAGIPAAPDAATVADAVASVDPSGYGVGTAGYAWAAAGSSTDFLSAIVPGAYASGTAGYILGSINPAQVTVTSPVATDGTSITVIRGDDYLDTDGRAITFTGATWPDISGGSVDLVVDVNGTPTRYTATITGAGSCYVELTSTQTTALRNGAHNYDLEATLSNGSVVTFVQGLLLVLTDVR